MKAKLLSLFACLLLLIASPAIARGHRSGTSHHSTSSKSKSASGHKVHVHGYFRKNGTYVAPHDRTAPNKTKNDNWSTRGNVNPETGKKGTKPRDEDKKPPTPR